LTYTQPLLVGFHTDIRLQEPVNTGGITPASTMLSSWYSQQALSTKHNY